MTKNEGKVGIKEGENDKDFSSRILN